ncbi:hypothetical protein ACO0LL_25810 [Undibacterium sp. TC4M20W]|uniref:hypothetical protein n=1 Tax=Undibacterium sp. TC4M20W TaxID=3413052 RepID=UPI003BEFE495
MKTTLRHSFILLAAASNLLLTTPEAQALEKKFDLLFTVVNSTAQVVEICDHNPTECKKIIPGDTYQNGYITNGEQVPNFYRWLYGTTIEICGKKVPLSRIGTPPVQENNGRSMIYYRMAINDEGYQRVCSDEKKPAGKHL